MWDRRDFFLHGLLIYRTHYLRLKEVYGIGFNETVAGSFLKIIDEEIAEAIADIDISDSGIRYIQH